jgi:dTDP-4-dehydrorhamnose 3,5-epimerase
MRFRQTLVHRAYAIEPEPRGDDRGTFARLWCQREFADQGLTVSVVQCNSSVNRCTGTLRGLHYQAAPHEEAKLVRCVRGSVFDVIVDLRVDSPTYLRWLGLELSPLDGKMLYVPEGCAHGYLTLEDDSEVIYLVSEFYHPETERGVRWNDPAFAIAWPNGGPRTVSAKDQSWADYVLPGRKKGA